MNRDQFRIRRILLALDQLTWSTGALETAAELAGRLGAELEALFVEDVDLIRLTELPFAMEIGCFSCGLRPLRLDDLEVQLRAQAAEMRKTLREAARRFGTEWALRVTRGRVASEILAASEEADLVILGKRGWNLSRRLGSTVQMVISQRAGMTLVLHPGAKLNAPVVALYNDSDIAPRVLEIASSLVRIKDGRLLVLIAAQDREQAGELEKHVLQYLDTQELETGVKVMIRPTLATLAYAVRDMGPVVVPCEQGFLRHEDLCCLMNETENPVLLIRRGEKEGAQTPVTSNE